MSQDLTALFSPKSVAVVGASRSPQKVGAIVLKNIINSKFSGKIYPVNPNTETINDLKCFPDLHSLPETPDLTVLTIPASQVSTILQQAGEKGIKNVVVLASGFRESGKEGEKLENELTELAQKYNINLLGPNCLGFVNHSCPINATFGQPVEGTGNLRFITQSGAIAASLFDWCQSTGLGFSEFITLGNKALINENDVLEYFQSHSNSAPNPEGPPAGEAGLSSVHPIGLYLESISNGTEFLKITSQISKTDPIFILKPGKTQAGATAMQSHTGAIAGEDAVLETALKQAGVIRCQTLEDFFDFARAFAWENAPSGPKVAIISNAGGPAVISADAVINEGLELAEFDDQTKQQLLQILPRSASICNPVDVLGDALADHFAQASEIILQKEGVHALVVILTPQVMTQIEKTAQYIADLSRKYHKPIFCSFIGGNLVAEGEQILDNRKIPSFRFPERAIAAISAMWRFKQHQGAKETDQNPALATQLNLAKTNEILQKAKADNQKTLDNLQANEILSSIEIPTPQTSAVAEVSDAKRFAQTYGWPVVLKLSAPELLHKKEIGGVITDICNEIQLQTAWNKLQQKIPQLENGIRNHVKIQVQKNIINGLEVIVGVKHDPAFGSVLLFGAGGTLTELIADRNLHLLPVEIPQAKELVAQSKIFPILPPNLDKLYELIVRLGKLAQLVPQIKEIEINPVIITFDDVWAVDGKVVINSFNSSLDSKYF